MPLNWSTLFFQHMMLSATVAAVVVISIERHRAVLHPLNEVNKHRPIIGDWRIGNVFISPSSQGSTFTIYIIFVIMTSISVNLPKFLEWTVYVDDKGVPVLGITALGENEKYMQWNVYWDQLLLHGVIPLVILIVLNTR